MPYVAWEQSRHIEQNYLTALKKLRKFLTDMIGDEDSLDVILLKLSALSRSDTLNKWSYAVAKTMVTNTLEEDARTWRQAERSAGKGQWLYDSQQRTLGGRTAELIGLNAQYIKSVPSDVADQLVTHVSTKAFRDNRNTYKAPEFRELVGQMTDNHARLIARTETSKAHAALNQAQAEDVGLDWYEWKSAHDIKTRDSHKFMEGILCRYSDTPNPEALFNAYGSPKTPMKVYGSYSPGNTFNCRCYARIIILWRNILWPHRVCMGNEIITMSKSEFFERFGENIGGKWAV